MTSVINKKVDNDSEDIDLGRIIGEVIDHRKLIISITALFTLLALTYALFATPIYQADALIQVEQKQANAILSNLSQMLPNSQPESAPEISLLQSRMIIGKTVDDLNLQARVRQNYFPIFGKGFSRITGEKPGSIEVSRLFIPNVGDDTPEIIVKIINENSFEVNIGDDTVQGKRGEIVDINGATLKIDKIEAKPGTEFTIDYVSRLKAITDLQENLTIVDQGKDTGILSISLTGDNKELISKIIDNISDNYLAQNIARQAAQDAKSLDFLNLQLPKVRSDLDIAENKLNQYRSQNDSVDLSLEAKSVLDQIVNVDN
ncbi:TPA: Wzz/FepE/Etk N-terminal domain-containing protein, partial [Escherichia coli]